MYLVFVRHGKAEYTCDDFLRALSEEGKDALHRFYPQLEHKLRESLLGFDDMSVAILSSPKTRALQTAQLLAEHLGLDHVEASETLLHYSLAAALREARKTGGDLVFLVGHDPMCSVWVSELCQEEVSFAKGAAALIDYRRPNEELKPLLWYLSPGRTP